MKRRASRDPAIVPRRSIRARVAHERSQSDDQPPSMAELRAMAERQREYRERAAAPPSTKAQMARFAGLVSDAFKLTHAKLAEHRLEAIRSDAAIIEHLARVADAVAVDRTSARDADRAILTATGEVIAELLGRIEALETRLGASDDQ